MYTGVVCVWKWFVLHETRRIYHWEKLDMCRAIFWPEIIGIYCWTGAKCTFEPQIKEVPFVTGRKSAPIDNISQECQNMGFQSFFLNDLSIRLTLGLTFRSIYNCSTLSNTSADLSQCELHFATISSFLQAIKKFNREIQKNLQKSKKSMRNQKKSPRIQKIHW